MSLYGDYLYEHRGDLIIEKDGGFATFRFIPFERDTAVYIVDIYVKPELRKSGLAREMADEIAVRGKHKLCKFMIGTVVPSANGATDSLKVLLAYGMKLHSSSQDIMVFRKEI